MHPTNYLMIYEYMCVVYTKMRKCQENGMLDLISSLISLIK